MTVNISDWTGDDIAIWWEISRRFDAEGIKRFTLLSHSEQSDTNDYELMRGRTGAVFFGRTNGYRILTPAVHWAIKAGLRLRITDI